MSSFKNRGCKQTSPQVAYVAQPNQSSNNAHIVQTEYDKFLQYQASKQTSPQVASVAQLNGSIMSNSFPCVHSLVLLDYGSCTHALLMISSYIW